MSGFDLNHALFLDGVFIPGPGSDGSIAPPPGPGYATGAVHFDGSVALDLAALSATNSSLLLYSYWWRDASDQSAETMMDIDPTGGQFLVEFPGGDGIATNSPNFFVSDDPYTGDRLQFGSNVGGTFNVWHHLIVALDVGHAAAARPHVMYLDDVDVTADVHDDGTTFIITANGKEFVLGGDSFGNNVTMDVADVWWGLDQFLDISVTANRRKFISATLKPVDLGDDGSTPTGTAPAFYLRRDPTTGTASDFATDKSGNGNTFTETGGTLSDASSSPSD